MNKILGILSIILAAVMWGSNGVFVNMVPLEGHVIATYRTLFAIVSMSPIIFLTSMKSFLKALNKWKIILMNGLVNALGWASLFTSMKLVPIAYSVFLNNLGLVISTVLTPFILKEKIKKHTSLSLSLAILGVFLILYRELKPESLNFLGILFGICSGVCYGLFIIFSKIVREDTPSLILAYGTYLTTSIFILPLALTEITNINLEAYTFLILLYMGVVNTTIAVTLYFYGLGFIEVQKVAVLTYFEPLSATILGTIFLSQTPSIEALIGGALILTAGYITSRY
ncbi:MAG: EamA family transporter [Nitrososphaerota archaeon]